MVCEPWSGKDPAALRHVLATSSEGTIQVSDDGKLSFELKSGGKHKQLKIVEEKKLDLMKHYIEMASAKPPARRFNCRLWIIEHRQL